MVQPTWQRPSPRRSGCAGQCSGGRIATMDQLPQQLIIGLSVGATYALIALGYTMVYGVLRLINFAHGDVYMVGAVSGYYLSRRLQAKEPSIISALLVMAGAMAVCAVLGILIERLAYRPVRR